MKEITLLYKLRTRKYEVSQHSLLGHAVALAVVEWDLPKNFIVRVNGDIPKEPNRILSCGDVVDFRLAEAAFGDNVMDISATIGLRIKDVVELFGVAPLRLPRDKKPLAYILGERVSLKRKIEPGNSISFAIRTRRWLKSRNEIFM